MQSGTHQRCTKSHRSASGGWDIGCMPNSILPSVRSCRWHRGMPLPQQCGINCCNTCRISPTRLSMLIQWRLQVRSTIAWRHMSTATCRPMRISSRPNHSATVFESLTGQLDGRVEPRPHVLQADDCRELDKLCRIKVGPQPLHKLVVKGAATVPDADLTGQREIVDAFLAASRGGDFDALLAVLAPDVVLRADRAAVPAGASREVRGTPAMAKQALAYL